jgi:hypothetical protein
MGVLALRTIHGKNVILYSHVYFEQQFAEVNLLFLRIFKDHELSALLPVGWVFQTIGIGSLLQTVSVMIHPSA